MSGLAHLLAHAASTYADLVDAALPGRAGDPGERPATDPTRKPAPGDLGVMEHRHELVTLLRWWVDAVRDPDERTRLGDDVPGMCRFLAAHEHAMAPEDTRLLYGRVRGWLATSAAIMGDPAAPEVTRAPTGACVFAHGMHACRAMIPVAEAVRILGVPVSTLKDRVPAGPDRKDGRVRIGAVVRSGCLDRG